MIVLLLLFGLALGAVVPPNEQRLVLERGTCPMFWYSYNGRCYKYVASRLTWADAELHCLSEGANLVSIHSLQEHNFVNSLIENFDPARAYTWIGLSDIHKEGSWMWSDGLQDKFVYFATGKPDNEAGQEHCAHTSWGPHFQWSDAPCSVTYAFVCATRKCFP
ncbi:lactose-binding lectin l-2-like [Stegastes partitus]|uniref:Lactose-binding lectin l-2-like n=1 Tax=Stegastes partitus TaxID=144197 RepID=A0A9Y4NFR5_9TELE|nr:PREDICTED: lactose-binding lectin l-2-like [Stegastes partitus]